MVKPLEGGKTAICYFNKTDSSKKFNFSENLFEKEEYVDYNREREIVDCLSGNTVSKEDMLSGEIKARSVKVFVI